MRAINLTPSAVELDPVNGGMLPAPVEDSDDHVRELEEVTEHEEALARAGVILLTDSAGRKRTPKPAAEPTPKPAPATGDADQ